LPDHSSLSRIRTRYGVEIFRRFFDAIVEQCQQAGLAWGAELSFDSTEVQANAALGSLTPRFALEAREATKVALSSAVIQAHSRLTPEALSRTALGVCASEHTACGAEVSRTTPAGGVV
jgi:hypothetical protein